MFEIGIIGFGAAAGIGFFYREFAVKGLLITKFITGRTYFLSAGGAIVFLWSTKLIWAVRFFYLLLNNDAV